MVRPNPEPRLSVLPNEDKDDAIVLSPDWLREAMATPDGAEDAYTRILSTIRERDHALEQVQRYKMQEQARETQIQELIDERDQLSNELLHTLRQAASRESSMQPATPSKSTKIPDPPVLTNGSEPTFEGWLSKIKNKLKVNADHFRDEQARMAYVQLQVDGEASEHIQPRLQDDAADPYTTAEDILSHLQSIYEDPNRVFNAKNEFKKLFMKNSQTFHEFYTKFLHLAGRAKIATSELKYELNNKLSYELQRQVIVPFHDDKISLKSFAAQCGVIDQSLKAIDERQNKN